VTKTFKIQQLKQQKNMLQEITGLEC